MNGPTDGSSIEPTPGNSDLIPSPTEFHFPESWNYEETVAEIESIIARIETGELQLAEVFDQFEAAVNHLQQCDAFLTNRQRTMDLLIETLTDKANPV